MTIMFLPAVYKLIRGRTFCIMVIIAEFLIHLSQGKR